MEILNEERAYNRNNFSLADKWVYNRRVLSAAVYGIVYGPVTSQDDRKIAGVKLSKMTVVSTILTKFYRKRWLFDSLVQS